MRFAKSGRKSRVTPLRDIMKSYRALCLSLLQISTEKLNKEVQEIQNLFAVSYP